VGCWKCAEVGLEGCWVAGSMVCGICLCDGFGVWMHSGEDVSSVLRSVQRVVGLLVRWCVVFVCVMVLGLGCIVGKMLVGVRWDLRGILGDGRTQDWGHVHYMS